MSESSYELDVEYSNKYKNNLTFIKYEDFFDINVINGVVTGANTMDLDIITSDNRYNDNKYNMNKINDTINVMFDYGTFNNTDKVVHHEYHKFYDSILQPFHNSYGGMIEIGIGEGPSLPMWMSIFKNAHVYGIDKVIKEISNVNNKDKHTVLSLIHISEPTRPY